MKVPLLILLDAEWTAGPSGHEGVNKNFKSSTACDRSQAVQPVAKRHIAVQKNAFAQEQLSRALHLIEIRLFTFVSREKELNIFH